MDELREYRKEAFSYENPIIRYSGQYDRLTYQELLLLFQYEALKNKMKHMKEMERIQDEKNRIDEWEQKEKISYCQEMNTLDGEMKDLTEKIKIKEN